MAEESDREPEETFFEETELVENETDLEDLLLTDLSGAVVQSTDWTTGTIVDQIEKGRIQLNPNFQRRDAWDDERKSKFIESLLLGFPIPQLVLAESQQQRGRYLIIDGKQRLLSLMQFSGSVRIPELRTLKLKNLEILKHLNGNTWNDLRSGQVTTAGLEEFENRTIRTVVIRHWKHEAVLYHIFIRLNQGNVQLSPQELRNALHPGPFAEFIDKYSADSPALRRILQNKKPDFRMRDAELLLRYYAFRNFLIEYAGSIKTFLDLTTQRLNSAWAQTSEDLLVQAKQFEEAVQLAYDVFGEQQAFRKWKDGKFTERFNRAVFDVILFHLVRPELRSAIAAHADDVKRAFVELSESNPEFLSSLESTTKSLGATALRLTLWSHKLSEVLGKDLPVPALVRNRIRL